MPSKKTQFDVIIVGAGLVGALFAKIISKQNLKLALVEAKPVVKPKSTGKALALNAASIQLLQSLGLWGELKPYAVPIKQVHVSYAKHFGAVKIRAEEENLEALGYLINEPDLVRVVNRALEDVTITRFQPARVTAWEEGVLTLDASGKLQQLTAQLVVAADGQFSALRELAAIQAVEKPYHEKALVTRLSISGFHKNTAFERFTDEGTFALMPQPNQNVALIITAENKIIDDWLALSDEAFLAKLQSVMGRRLGRFLEKTETTVYPLASRIAEKQAQAGLILLGASAHNFHPVAAQGLNLCLREAVILARLLEALPTESALLCERYLKETQAIQKGVIGLTEGIVSVFKRWRLPLLPQLGLLSAEYFPGLRRKISRIGMGIASS